MKMIRTVDGKREERECNCQCHYIFKHCTCDCFENGWTEEWQESIPME